MTRNEVKNTILSILSSKDRMSLQIETSEISEDTSLLRDVNLDSIQILELTVAIEQAFSLSLESEELTLSLFDRFGDLVDFLDRKVSSELPQAVP